MKRILIITIILMISLAFAGLLSAQNISYKVVVNKENPVTSLSKKEVSNLFLKKVSKWANGTKVLAVDLADTSEVRQVFSQDIHGRKVSSVKSYWQKQIFSGREVPPVEKKSDGEVLVFVKNNPGAIGYVSASISLNRYDVKILQVQK